MKHLPIGKIKEIEHEGKVTYNVSLFHNHVHEKFEKRSDAIGLIQFHAEEFLKLGETNAICIEYYNTKHQMHYIMIDTNFAEKTKPEVHEQTRYEYMQSHSLYFPKWAGRRVLNERLITASDVLRSTINFRPWYSIIYIIVALLMAAFSTVYIVEAVNYLDENSVVGTHVPMPHRLIDLWLSLGLFAFTLLASGYTIASMYITRRKIIASGGDYSRINWHKWYKVRLWTTIIFTIFSAGALVVLILFTNDHIRNFSTLSPMPTFDDRLHLLVSIYCLYGLFGFLFVTMLAALIFIFVHKYRVLRMYFNKKERKAFRKWLRHKTDNEVSYSAGREFFLLDPITSEYAVLKEVQVSREIRVKYTNDEYNDYKHKAIHHFNESMKIYIHRLKEIKRGHLPENN